ncbi:hypothetical protein MHI18_04370 [Peribacillus sp. FSL H8-0477]|uniref:hypothetical protein n=1 Tax=Peribacillus sp. FSL H8-0477 TaxID=2921388 RepID=UPI0030F587B8
MVWFFILATVIAYGFVMKHVLNNVQRPVRKLAAAPISRESVRNHNLIPVHTTR